MEDQELSNATKKIPKFSLEGKSVLAKVVNCYDGDTIQVVFRLSCEQPLYRYSCRMLGYDCAEIKGKTQEEKDKAKIARDRLKELVLDKIVKIELGSFDKYGRLLVKVSCNGININQVMMDENHGVKYDGKGDKYAKLCITNDVHTLS